MHIQITVSSVDWDRNKLVLKFRAVHNGKEATYTDMTYVDMLYSYFDIMFDSAKRKIKDCLLRDRSENEWQKRKEQRG